MRMHICLAALAWGAVAIPASAQDAASLVAKNLEARGGDAAIAAIKNVSFVGRTIFPGDFEVTYRETKARLPGGATGDRIDYGIQGLNITQAYDGRGAWRVNPLQGRKDAEKLSADEVRAMADGALIDGPLLAAKANRGTVTYLGREDFDGTLAYKLKVVQPDGDQFVYWLDPDTYLEIKIAETRKIRGASQTTETELGDYEKVAGVYFPMSVDSWPQGQDNQRQRTIIASGTANGPVADSLFAEPRGTGAVAATTVESGDASDKSQGKPANDKPAATKKPPVSPAKPSKGN